MIDPCDGFHLLIQAELDGELDAAGAAGLAEHVGRCAACAALRTELTALQGRVRREVTRFSAPPALVRRVRPPPASLWRRAQRGRAWRHAASFGAGVAVAASVALFALRPSGDSAEFADLVAAHNRALQPGHLLDVPSTDRHTVKPWFNGRVGFSPLVPDPAEAGFPLIGGRLDYLGDQPAAVLVYGRRKHLIDVFVAPGAAPLPSRSQGGFNTIGWVKDGLVYQAVSDLNAAELATFAGLMQRS